MRVVSIQYLTKNVPTGKITEAQSKAVRKSLEVLAEHVAARRKADRRLISKATGDLINVTSTSYPKRVGVVAAVEHEGCIYIGISRCHKRDKFNRVIGRKIAVSRAQKMAMFVSVDGKVGRQVKAFLATLAERNAGASIPRVVDTEDSSAAFNLVQGEAARNMQG